MRGGEPIELCLVWRVGKRPLRFLGLLGQPGPSKHFDYVLEGLAHWTSSRSWPGHPALVGLLVPAFRPPKAAACSATATEAIILDGAPAAYRE